MAKQGKSGIAWTEQTWNPIRGCTRVSEGCRNCYAERVAARFSGHGQPYEGLAVLKHGDPRWTGTIRFVEEHLEDPLHWKQPRMIFVNSMSDLFHENVMDEWIDKIFDVMAKASQHIFQILTKRPQRMMRYSNKIYLPNVWLGVSVEDQETADQRIPYLLETSAKVRWVSYEPALGPVDFWGARYQARGALNSAFNWEEGLKWVVVGGESGPGAREMDLQWALDVKEQCRHAEVAFFFKQGSETGEYARNKNFKNLECFPEALRVREYPRGEK